MKQIDEALTTIDNTLTTLRDNRKVLISMLYRNLLDKTMLFYAHKRLTQNLKETLI